jgi:hypothetical protein
VAQAAAPAARSISANRFTAKSIALIADQGQGYNVDSGQGSRKAHRHSPISRGSI